MVKKLVRVGHSLAVVLDKPLLKSLGLEPGASLEVSVLGRLIVLSPLRARKRLRRIQAVVEELDREYAGLFARLAE